MCSKKQTNLNLFANEKPFHLLVSNKNLVLSKLEVYELQGNPPQRPKLLRNIELKLFEYHTFIKVDNMSTLDAYFQPVLTQRMDVLKEEPPIDTFDDTAHEYCQQ